MKRRESNLIPNTCDGIGCALSEAGTYFFVRGRGRVSAVSSGVAGVEGRRRRFSYVPIERITTRREKYGEDSQRERKHPCTLARIQDSTSHRRARSTSISKAESLD